MAANEVPEKRKPAVMLPRALSVLALCAALFGLACSEVDRTRGRARFGDADAPFDLAARYASGRGLARDEAEAAAWYLKAAEQGVGDAQLELGMRYDAGEGVAEDDAEAARRYRKAAEQGLPDAQFDLALMYAEGKGVPEDDGEATKWFRRAAAHAAPGASRPD